METKPFRAHDYIRTPAQIDGLVRLAAEQEAEIERLRAALAWIETYEPETVEIAKARFGIDQQSREGAGK